MWRFLQVSAPFWLDNLSCWQKASNCWVNCWQQKSLEVLNSVARFGLFSPNRAFETLFGLQNFHLGFGRFLGYSRFLFGTFWDFLSTGLNLISEEFWNFFSKWPFWKHFWPIWNYFLHFDNNLIITVLSRWIWLNIFKKSFIFFICPSW